MSPRAKAPTPATSPASSAGSAQATWMPCLGDAGLALFGATADQRAILGAELFAATHFPMTMRTQATGTLTSRVTEEELLTELLATSHLRPGNRVFVLYGAAGAGKSELLRWLAQEVAHRDPARERALVRVSRTELDVVRIVERFQAELSGRYFSSQTHARWEDLHNKPLTLAKLLVLSALERLLTRDEEINALFYWLTAPVQRNLEAGLALFASNSSEAETLELFSEEDWTSLVQTTELSQLLEAEPLREALAAAFRGLLLENIHLPSVLTLLSEEVRDRHGVRPILLIDDLVRSLNLFAGDLMDYFITLEAGNWDVVVGVTPASLQTHARGRQLLERIAYLDTIDDRVQKLWLSDDFGHESYFLHEQNCADFAARYLDQYRKLNGVACNQCVQQVRCRNLGLNAEGRLLAPFSRNALQRVLRALPSGKGKARYFLAALAEMLRKIAAGEEVPSVLAGHAHREFLAHADTKSEAALIEFYAEINDTATSVSVDAGVGHFFGASLQESYEVEALSAQVEQRSLSSTTPNAIPAEDPQRGAIRRWLEAEATNRHLLHPVRQGVARWLRLVGAPHVLTRQGVARPIGVLRWEQRYLDVTPPIFLADVDEIEEGITIGREIGLLAFDFANLARAKGEETTRLASRIAETEYTATLMQAGRDLRTRLLTRLETQLGMSPVLAAMHLYIFALCLGQAEPKTPGFPQHFWQWLSQEQQRRAAWAAEMSKERQQLLVQLFTDFFRLRENLVDGPTIARLCSEEDTYHRGGWLRPLLALTPDRLEPAFMLGDFPLIELIFQVQGIVKQWLQEGNQGALSPATATVLEALASAGRDGIALTELSPAVLAELAATKPEIIAALRIWWEGEQQGR